MGVRVTKVELPQAYVVSVYHMVHSVLVTNCTSYSIENFKLVHRALQRSSQKTVKISCVSISTLYLDYDNKHCPDHV